MHNCWERAWDCERAHDWDSPKEFEDDVQECERKEISKKRVKQKENEKRGEEAREEGNKGEGVGSYL